MPVVKLQITKEHTERTNGVLGREYKRPPAFKGDVTVENGRFVVSVAVALIGPGAYYLDARFFGFRQIVIPRSSNRPPHD
jgi:hypothetical protein